MTSILDDVFDPEIAAYKKLYNNAFLSPMSKRLDLEYIQKLQQLKQQLAEKIVNVSDTSHVSKNALLGDWNVGEHKND